MYYFLVFTSVCLYAYYCALFWPCVREYEYQEQPSSEHFEQQQEQYEEGKYNMNNPSLLNTFSYCILILYAYKDFLAT